MRSIMSFFVIGVLLWSPVSFGASTYLSGNIKNLTTTTQGLLIMLDTGLPDNCEGSPYGWMSVKQECSAMTSTTLALWIAGKRSVTVYTSGIQNGSSFCVINQVDPAG